MFSNYFVFAAKNHARQFRFTRQLCHPGRPVKLRSKLTGEWRDLLFRLTALTREPVHVRPSTSLRSMDVSFPSHSSVPLEIAMSSPPGKAQPASGAWCP